MKIYNLLIVFLLVFTVSCSEKSDIENALVQGEQKFTLVSPDSSGVAFTNTLKEDLRFNFITYPYIYTGAGVATGDINNDGLLDIYFVANQGANKLYLNKGNFKFEDISSTSLTEDNEGFSTGVTMLDVNNDGWLDIYVCKSASLQDNNGRKNKLYINNQDNTFTENAEKWGLADAGFSTQAYTLDYDRDGDLDIYVLNYRADFSNNTKIDGAIQRNIIPAFSDQLYRNDGDKFKNVTTSSGLSNKAWGLGVSVGDFNEDGYPDLYVSNDYLEPDIMYINQKDGTFKNEILERINHISFNSMGSDYADVDNDGYSDLFTLDMLADDHQRGKENMASMSTSNFETMVKVGYHHQYMSNMLHVNNNEGYFKEVGQLSGISKTDWSWAPLIADFDNDGLKDIYITNGIYRDITNQDFLNRAKELRKADKSFTLEQVYDMIPSEKLPNYFYKNSGNLSFDKKTKEWGLEKPSHSNGAVYADLDNDGDLDLITNNFNEISDIYRNESQWNYLDFEFINFPKNSLGIGTTVKVYNNDNIQTSTLFLSRGFESSIAPRLHFGLGNDTEIEKITVEWPNGKTTELNDVAVNQIMKVDYNEVSKDDNGFVNNQKSKKPSVWETIAPETFNINYTQKENEFNDYNLQLLLPHKKSTVGSALAVGDINNDGLDDFFVGNAKDATAALYMQSSEGKFQAHDNSLWEKEAVYEDTGALFFDADQDGDLDLYVVSGGYELRTNDPLLQDRLYINNGAGKFTKSENLPVMLTSGKSVIAGDYDKDGDLDLFIGGYVKPGRYPEAPRSYLLENSNGNFVDVTEKIAIDISKTSMISDAIFSDYDGDGDLDIVTVGEWSPINTYENNNDKFEKVVLPAFDKTSGWWQSITASDVDNDGDDDYLVGNLGANNKFHPSQKKPLHIYAKDFDKNGSFDIAMSKVNNGKLVPVRGKECSSEQNPFLLEKIGTYKEFASNDMAGIYGSEELESALHLSTDVMETVFIENLGKGSFTVRALPQTAQTGPTMGSVFLDVDNDGKKDILGIGAIYDAEVETIRYDSNFGYTLKNTTDGWKTLSSEYQPMLKGDYKNIETINIKGEQHIIAIANNAPLKIIKRKS
ncbi:RNA-binding protein [Dokdonia sinensis]|uniref:RNA-binding protein n=1 Tax=Dokdonia sinensis TaxID=2479847 RepID=A0A3M0GMI1_9FLAO|nr:VCBS repeat-containing protein [Dokdonia sinensis]RMB63922.1 RNA-binding protein [Dokdonia sinensis]